MAKGWLMQNVRLSACQIMCAPTCAQYTHTGKEMRTVPKNSFGHGQTHTFDHTFISKVILNGTWTGPFDVKPDCSKKSGFISPVIARLANSYV